MHDVLATFLRARLAFLLAGAVILARQGDTLLLAIKQASVFLVVNVGGLVEQAFGPGPRQPTQHWLLTQLRRIVVFDHLAARGGDGPGLSLSGLVVEFLNAPTRDRLDPSRQTIKRLLPEHDVIDADQRRQILAAMRGKPTVNHGVNRQDVFDQPVEVVVAKLRHALHLAESDNFFVGPSKAVIKKPMEADRLLGQIEAFDAGRLFEQVEPSLRHSAYLRAGPLTYTPTTLDRAFGIFGTNRIGFLERFDAVGAGDTVLLPPVVKFVFRGQRAFPCPVPIELTLFNQVAEGVMSPGIGLAWRAAGRGIIRIIPLFVSNPVEPVEPGTGFNPLDVKHPLFSLISRIGTEKILIVTGRLKVRTRRYRYTDDPPQLIIDRAYFHVVVIAIEQRLAIEQRMLQGNYFLNIFSISEVPEPRQGFLRL
ncbi:hypothetical protein D3C85_747900 [compost metagenome]